MDCIRGSFKKNRKTQDSEVINCKEGDNLEWQ